MAIFKIYDGTQWVEIAKKSELSNYLPLSGGTVNGSISINYTSEPGYTPALSINYDNNNGGGNLGTAGLNMIKFGTIENYIGQIPANYSHLGVSTFGLHTNSSHGFEFMTSGWTWVATLTPSGVFNAKSGLQVNGTNVCLTNDSRLSDARPASDVYSWAKQPNKPTYYFNEIYGRGEAFLEWGGQSIVGGFAPIDASLVSQLSANRVAGIDGSYITIERSNDSGSTWTEVSTNDFPNFLRKALFTTSTFIPLRYGSQCQTSDRLRITMDATSGGIYTAMNKIMMYVSTSGSSGCNVHIDTAFYNSPTEWHDVGDYTLSGWSGWNVINLSLPGTSCLGGSNAGEHNRFIRLTFSCTGVDTTYTDGLEIYKIYMFGGVGWSTPSVLAREGVPYTYDQDGNIYCAYISENGISLSNKYLGINANAVSASIPYGFSSRRTSDWSGVSGTLVTDWSYSAGGDIMFKDAGGYLNVITDGFFYQGHDIYGSSQRVLDEYDISHTQWGSAVYATSAANARLLVYQDTRDAVVSVSDAVDYNGIKIEFKNKTASSIPSTGTWTALITLDGYSDSSGGYPSQLGFSMSDLGADRHLYMRSPSDSSTWGAWKTFAFHGDNISNFTNDSGYATETWTGNNFVKLDGSNTMNYSGLSIYEQGDNTSFVNYSYNGVKFYSTEVGVLGSGINFPTVIGFNNTFALTSDIPTNNNQLTNGAGYITGISSSDVTTALGYTPYNSSNPNGYTSNVGTVTSVNNVSPDANGNVSLTIPTQPTLYLHNISVTDGNFNRLTISLYSHSSTAISSIASLMSALYGSSYNVNSFIHCSFYDDSSGLTYMFYEHSYVSNTKSGFTIGGWGMGTDGRDWYLASNQQCSMSMPLFDDTVMEA